MPEAVAKYIETGDVTRVRLIHRQILDAYVRDFAKHAGDETQRVRLVWESVPGHLSRENKKFIFGAVKSGARASYFDKALQWLVDAGLIYRVENVGRVESPLKFYANRDAFKAYALDVGLLGAMMLMRPDEILVKKDVFSCFKGAFTENYVLSQLRAIDDIYTYYYSKPNSTLEIDFLCQTDSGIVPIEVKAEVNVKAKSLATFARTYNGTITKALRFSMLPYVDQGWMYNVPLYAVGMFMKQPLG